ncbi:helitron helicase-like domain-containing protein [Artemisia annua]|uniref:Helitron helicase-like domain-containing protein n=1 Tax=Artemisia annua TaxID=35608 RepID=A0A2U1L8L3_ARTAN|nr:helitron helicase-like domain-containing protein [Artemisia annua]
MSNLTGENGLGNQTLIGNEKKLGINTTGMPYDGSPNISENHTCSTKRAFHATSSYNSSTVLQPQRKKTRSSEICEEQQHPSDSVSIVTDDAFNLKNDNKNPQFIPTSGTINHSENKLKGATTMPYMASSVQITTTSADRDKQSHLIPILLNTPTALNMVAKSVQLHQFTKIEVTVTKDAKLYIYDTENEVANKMKPFGGKDGSHLQAEIVQSLIQILDDNNELVRTFRTAREKCNEANVTEFMIQLYNVVGTREYQLPSSGTVGAIVFESGANSQTDYNVIIEYKDRDPQRINKLHSSYISPVSSSVCVRPARL